MSTSPAPASATNALTDGLSDGLRAGEFTVAVVGATGKQGGAAARALLAAGHPVRALTRSTTSPAAAALRRIGAEVVAADLDDPDSISTAFAGADGVFGVTALTREDGPAGEVRHGFTIADAAVAAGVAHLVYSSVGGADRSTDIPHFESKWTVEQHLASLDLPVTVIRPVFFMDNLLRTAVTDGQVTVALALPADIPLQMIASTDIGRVAAAVLGRRDWYGRSVEIAGDELTGPQMAKVFAAVSGLPARYQALPLGAMAGDPDLHRMYEWFAEPVAYTADFATTRALDPPVMDLHTWLAQSGWPAPTTSP